MGGFARLSALPRLESSAEAAKRRATVEGQGSLQGMVCRLPALAGVSPAAPPEWPRDTPCPPTAHEEERWAVFPLQQSQTEEGSLTAICA